MAEIKGYDIYEGYKGHIGNEDYRLFVSDAEYIEYMEDEKKEKANE